MTKEIWRLQPTFPVNQVTANYIMNPKPPTVYAILNSIVNYGKEEKTKIRNLAKECHDKIFDFDYELSDKVDKDKFEIQILNHFLMRRIGSDTVTAFQIKLEDKLNSILPYYNYLFDSLADFSLFNSGEEITRNKTDDRNITNNSVSTSNGTNVADNKYSKYPMDQLSDIMDGSYVTEQNYNTNTTNNSTNMDTTSNDNNVTVETIKRTPVDKMALYKSYLETNKAKIMILIYQDLDDLFYQLAD